MTCVKLHGDTILITSRFKPSLRVLGIMVLVLFASVATAQDEEGFSGRAGLGFLATSGNSDNESLNGNFALWWNYKPWSHALSGVVIRSSTAGTTTADAMNLAWQSKYGVNESDYIFGQIAWDKDEFSAYDQQTRETIGYGRRFIDNERHLLSVEIGAGARQADLRDGTSQDDTILYLGGDYRWAISETSQFTQSLGIETGSNNTYLESVSALSANVRNDLALVISFTVKNNSDVLPGTEKTDTFTTISLEYAF